MRCSASPTTDIIADVIHWLEHWRPLPDGPQALREDRWNFLEGLRVRENADWDCVFLCSLQLVSVCGNAGHPPQVKSCFSACFILLRGPDVCGSLY